VSLAAQGIVGSRSVRPDGPMLALYLWTYASSIVALGVFLGLGAAAMWGALGMGLVAIPLAVTVVRHR
jgi:putative membrane protein